MREMIPAKGLDTTIVVEGEKGGWVESVALRPGKLQVGGRKLRLPVSRELLEYVKGSRREFSDSELHAERIGRMRGSFHRSVLLRTMEIPYGSTMAYSEVAEDLGSRAWRATGTALANNPLPILVPCHRVVAKGGIGGYGGQVWLKRRLLELEGTEVP